ncbi:MAG: NAD(P)-dependent glycerol-1-phosphate dehydrogenase [Candidatus Hydrothermarchaeota archaeon]|nr:NAD(P)-dependent glycerol-1-phosphate dehydrogenase [Candidatus Hydrothermarchaeota archaeon]
MRTKFMQLPRAVLVGKGTLARSNEICRDLGLEGRVLIVSGPKTYKIAGERLYDILEKEHDIEVAMVKEGSLREVEDVKKTVQKKDIKVLVGVGGGRVIDTAKLASKETEREFLSVPTAASHDGIASSRASLKRDGNAVSIQARAPLGVIADTEIIRKAPYRLIASGCGDIISKFTAVKDWELAHRVKGEEISEYACALSLMTAKMIMDSKDLIKKGREESVRKVVKALISSGVAMSIAGSSRPGSGSEHKFSHALNMIAPSPALHGEQCGVGSIMMMYLHEDGWRDIRDALKKIGAPTNTGGLGVKEEHITEALTNAHQIRPERYTVLDGVAMSREKAKSIAKATGVIK